MKKQKQSALRKAEMIMDNEMKELDLEALDKVSGGVLRTVNTDIPTVGADMRAQSKKRSALIGHIPNGTQVDTVTDELHWDPDTKRHYVQISYNGKIGWIASSELGMKR